MEQNGGVRMDFSGGKGDFLLFGGFCHYFGVLSAREAVESVDPSVQEQLWDCLEEE